MLHSFRALYVDEISQVSETESSDTPASRQARVSVGSNLMQQLLTLQSSPRALWRLDSLRPDSLCPSLHPRSWAQRALWATCLSLWEEPLCTLIPLAAHFEKKKTKSKKTCCQPGLCFRFNECVCCVPWPHSLSLQVAGYRRFPLKLGSSSHAACIFVQC